MATIIPSKFTKYNLTHDELLSGKILTDTQRMVISNLLADIASEKLTLKYDPLNPYLFVQQEAELQGQLGILDLLLTESDNATKVYLHSSL